MAAAVARIRGDAALAAWLVDAGHRRLADFAAPTIRQRFVEVLAAVAEPEPVVA